MTVYPQSSPISGPDYPEIEKFTFAVNGGGRGAYIYQGRQNGADG
jgi:hypothetical protein